MGMFRSVTAKAAWVGRTTSMVFGLALVMALVIGAASLPERAGLSFHLHHHH